MHSPSPQELFPESFAYQKALRHWQHFQEAAKILRLDKMLCKDGAIWSPEYIESLNLLPSGERRPVAFGTLTRIVTEVSLLDYARIRESILPDASPFELGALEAVKTGSLALRDKLPVTIEEFPSRIWERALASRSPERLVAAGCQAVDSTLRLLSQIDYIPQADEGDYDEVVWRIDIGDVPEVFDLIALPPREHLGMKTRLIEALMAKVEADQSTMFKEVFETIPAWVLLDDANSDSRFEQLRKDTRNLMDEYLVSEKKNPWTRYRLRKLGRLLFRLGHRKESLRAAKSLGLSAWSEGWQFQPVGGAAHAAIRKRLLRPGTHADAWRHEPALACSAMSLPLWLVDGVSRVPELTQLFNQAGAFPWIFPRLYHVFQWHLAIAGKQEALKEVSGMCTENDLGLANE